MNYPAPLDTLIEELRRLPGVGRRGATRIAMVLLKRPACDLARLGKMIADLKESVTFCPECGALSGEGLRCTVCRSSARDRRTVCVVSNVQEMLSIEESGDYHGIYHVLGGAISPLDDRMGEDLNIDSLLRRVEENGIKEVILALPSDVEGRATAAYLADLLKDKGIRLSRLAQGLPAGTQLVYADGATVAAALRGRVSYVETP